jgi:CO/xanthine dehydrogenase Mo-binding subunit
MITLNVNGVRHEVQAPDDTPLLYVLRNDLRLLARSSGGGSEAANALAAPALAAALHDATGKVLRRLPLKPAYVQTLLKT